MKIILRDNAVVSKEVWWVPPRRIATSSKMANVDKVVGNMPTAYPSLLPLLLHRKGDFGFVEGVKVSRGGKFTWKKDSYVINHISDLLVVFLQWSKLKLCHRTQCQQHQSSKCSKFLHKCNQERSGTCWCYRKAWIICF